MEVHGMTKKRPPTIGVTCSEFQQEPLSPRAGQNQSYVRALVRAGAAPLLIPSLTDETLLRTVYERLDGLLLAGGVDVHPARYGEPIHEKCGSISPDRDEAELALARWAMDDGLPLLAICRGIQMLNVALGGSLYQDIQAQVPGAERHDWYPGYPRDHLPHTVAVTSHTRLAHLLDTTSVPVNSLHHQALKDLAPALTVTARAPDGIVEAVEAGAHPFAVAVQWHPEELAEHDVHAQRLFDALAEACLAQSY
jgi:putative glutamine amidotransferase